MKMSIPFAIIVFPGIVYAYLNILNKTRAPKYPLETIIGTRSGV